MLNKFFLCCIFFSGIALKAQSYIVGSYNIRYANPRDSGNLWGGQSAGCRKPYQVSRFWLLGTQEGFLTQLNDISEALPQYARYGRGRDDGNSKGEHSAIFYKRISLKWSIRVTSGYRKHPIRHPWVGCNLLSPYLFLASFAGRKNKKQFFISSSFDHQGVKAREESSKLILQNIQRIAGNKAVIFMGDLMDLTRVSGIENCRFWTFERYYTLVEKPYATMLHTTVSGSAETGKILWPHLYFKRIYGFKMGTFDELIMVNFHPIISGSGVINIKVTFRWLLTVDLITYCVINCRKWSVDLN